MFVGLAMAELASAAPTSGGLYFWTWTFSSPKYKKILSWVVGHANTIGTIAGIASIDWGRAVQVMAAAAIGSGGKFRIYLGQTYAVYLAILFTHAIVCSLAASLLARLQNLYVILNLVLLLAIFIALPVSTPAELKNSASYALGDFTNLSERLSRRLCLLPLLARPGLDDRLVRLQCAYQRGSEMEIDRSNATVAVPWSIVGAIGISGILGTAVNIVIAFCMGTDTEPILNNDIGRSLAAISFNSFGEKTTLGIWSVVVITQWAMPFSNILYRMNDYTETPVNTVWFSVFIAALLGLLAFAGSVAIMAVFSIAVIGLYIAGLPVATIAIAFMSFITIALFFPSTPAPGVADMNYEVVVLGGVMAGSIIRYHFPKYEGVYSFEGPISTIDIGDGASSARTRAASTVSFDKSREKNDARVAEQEIPEESV
ncbi:hypothetical protein B0J17DRAFT_715157 [Rhizoctonia solani]|nr:hypothetical protein B0J17DRAFT_715157 [Rhizoctonia solani]